MCLKVIFSRLVVVKILKINLVMLHEVD